MVDAVSPGVSVIAASPCSCFNADPKIRKHRMRMGGNKKINYAEGKVARCFAPYSARCNEQDKQEQLQQQIQLSLSSIHAAHNLPH